MRQDFAKPQRDRSQVVQGVILPSRKIKIASIAPLNRLLNDDCSLPGKGAGDGNDGDLGSQPIGAP